VKHDFDMAMDWCRRCGRPYYEIMDGDLAECDGLRGVVHQRYIKAAEEAHRIFAPIIDGVLNAIKQLSETCDGNR
jgi:ribosomal protein L37E